jgi:hypothetical protein
MRKHNSNSPILDRQLEQWGSTVSFPETPSIAPVVRRRLTAQPRRTTSRFATRMRWTIAAPVIAVAGAAAGLVFLLQPGNSAPPTAFAILKNAADATPPPHYLIKQTFLVHERVHGKAESGVVNVWESANDGAYSVLEVRRQPKISAIRYIQTANYVSRLWSSSATVSEQLMGLRGTPAKAIDGRLIATRLATASNEDWVAAYVGTTSVDRHRAYELSLTKFGTNGQAVTIDIDAATYRLLAIHDPDYSAQVTKETLLRRSVVPGLVSTYLKSHTQPPRVSSGSAAAY